MMSFFVSIVIVVGVFPSLVFMKFVFLMILPVFVVRYDVFSFSSYTIADSIIIGFIFVVIVAVTMYGPAIIP
jgi:hypothetical protein